MLTIKLGQEANHELQSQESVSVKPNCLRDLGQRRLDLWASTFSSVIQAGMGARTGINISGCWQWQSFHKHHLKSLFPALWEGWVSLTSLCWRGSWDSERFVTRPRSHSWGRRCRCPNINMSIKPGSVLHRASQVMLKVNNTRDTGSIPASGWSPGGGHGNPLHYSCLENSMDRGAWRDMVHRVAKSWARLKQFSMHACICVSYTVIPLLLPWSTCRILLWVWSKHTCRVQTQVLNLGV